MQERSSVIILVVILAICCLGLYVAVSGYRNSINPVAVLASPAAPATIVVVVLNTDTPAPATPAPTGPPATSVPVPSPLGAFQTITTAVAISTPRTTPGLATRPAFSP